MEDNAEFKIIGNIGELSLSQKAVNSLKIDFRSLSDSEYELFLSIVGSTRIILSKFSVNCSSNVKNKDEQDCYTKSVSQLSLWKTLCLPFNINHFAVSNQSSWLLGEDFYIDISSYMKSLFQEQESYLQPEKDLMDIDSRDEFHLQEFETSIAITSVQKYKPFSEKIFLNSHLFKGDIIICSKDAISMTWQLDLIIPSHDILFGAEHSKIINLVHFPVTYNESSKNLPAADATSKPVIIFIYDKESNGQAYNALQMNLLKKLLGTFPLSSSNCICFIGHPEGKLLYYLCTVSSEEHSIHIDTQPEIIYDIKQPIKGIHFQRELNNIKGKDSLLIIGKLGKLVFVTAENFFHNSVAIKIKNELLHITVLYLPSSVETHILLKQNIIFISNNSELLISEFNIQEASVPHRNQEIKLSKIAVMHGVVKMVLLNKLKGLFLLVTRSGQLYLSEYCKQKTEFKLSVSLASLMNMIMQQSSVLHNLSLLSKMQQDFFASVSKFASLKFNGIQKLKVTCLVTEIDEPPKKYHININIETTEKFDPRFWFVTVFLYSFYQKDSIVISKTLPYEADQLITLEVKESLLCPPHSSPFPLYLEAGLLLILPEAFKYEESFKLIAEILPFYIKIETLIINELYLLKPKTDLQQNKSQHDLQSSKNALTEICLRNLKKPIAHALQISHKNLPHYPQDFSFCLFSTDSKQRKAPDSLSMDNIVEILKKRNKLPDVLELHSLTFKNQVAFHKSDYDEVTHVTLRSKSFFLLVGLRVAIMELLYIQSTSVNCGSKCVSISASVNKQCEKLSKELLSMYGQDVEAESFMDKIASTYCQLRKLSKELPFN